MRFKSDHMRAQFERLPIFLKIVVWDFCEMSTEFGIEPIITRISDPVNGESGVHPDLRAVDIRDEFQGQFTYTEDERLALSHYLNAKYKRSDSYKTCVHHSFGGDPFHFHIQVSRDMNVYRK